MPGCAFFFSDSCRSSAKKHHEVVELLEVWNLDNREKTIVMVTHEIEKAIFLSERIVVMSNGPETTIKEIVPVPLERPRNKKLIVHDPMYMEIHDHLLNLLIEKFSIND